MLFLWGPETNLQLTDLKSIFHARCETVRIHGEEEVPHVGRSGLNIGSDNLQTDPHKYQDGHNDNNKLLYWGSFRTCDAPSICAPCERTSILRSVRKAAPRTFRVRTPDKNMQVASVNVTAGTKNSMINFSPCIRN